MGPPQPAKPARWPPCPGPAGEHCAGDPVEYRYRGGGRPDSGKLLQPIVERRSKRTIAPAGAAVRGRITHLMHHTQGEQYFAISIVWEGLEADGKWLPFAALLDRPASVGIESRQAGIWIVFYIAPGSAPRLPKGQHLRLRDLDVQVRDTARLYGRMDYGRPTSGQPDSLATPRFQRVNTGSELHLALECCCKSFAMASAPCFEFPA